MFTYGRIIRLHIVLITTIMKTLHKSLDILPSVRCGLYVDGQWLLVRRTEASGHNAGLWEWPGGKVERNRDGIPSETFEAAAIRETNEEVGLTPLGLKPLSIVEAHPILDGKRAGAFSITVGFLATTYSGIAELDNESSELTWATDKQISQMLTDGSLAHITHIAIERALGLPATMAA